MLLQKSLILAGMTQYGAIGKVAPKIPNDTPSATRDEKGEI